MPEPCTFPSLDSCQKRFLWTHKEVALAPHPIVGFVRQVEDAEKFTKAFGFESLEIVSESLTAVEEDGVDKRLVQLELA